MPFARQKFRAHLKAHQTVISNERWFRKGPPFLGKPFTVKKMVQRHATVIKNLSRAGRRATRAGNDELADAYHQLRAKLKKCRPRWRCGSSPAPSVQGRSSGPRLKPDSTPPPASQRPRGNKHLVL
jgi:hypothetical protein